MCPCYSMYWRQLTVNSATKSTQAGVSEGGRAVTTVQAFLHYIYNSLIIISLPNNQIIVKHCSHHILHWFSWLMSQGVQLRSACKCEPNPAIAQSLPYGSQKLESFTSANCRHSFLLSAYSPSLHTLLQTALHGYWSAFPIFNSVKHLAGNSPCSNICLIKNLTSSYH